MDCMEKFLKAEHNIKQSTGFTADDATLTVRMIELYKQTKHPFWDDPHISQSMLKAHLDPTNDQASRKPETIQKSVDWILGLRPDAKTILDLGCGPGLYTQRFHHAGLEVTGIDISKRSIEYAKSQEPDIDYRVANYLTLDDEDAYDIITLIYFDYGVLSPEDRHELLKSVWTALKPGGVFVLDVYHENYRRSLEESSGIVNMGNFFTDEPHTVRLTTVYYPETKNYLDQYDVMTENESRTYYTWNQLFTIDDIKAELEPVGFRAEFYSDMTGNANDDQGESITIVATKG